MTVSAFWRRARKHRSRKSTRGVAAYRRLLVPVSPDQESLSAVDLACQLARETRAAISMIAVVEVPAELPLAAHMREEEKAASHVLEAGQGIADSYGIGSSARIVRGREAGEAIIDEASQAHGEIIVLSARRKQHPNSPAQFFGTTVRFVLKHASCRVMVAARRAPTDRRVIAPPDTREPLPEGIAEGKSVQPRDESRQRGCAN